MKNFPLNSAPDARWGFLKFPKFEALYEKSWTSWRITHLLPEASGSPTYHLLWEIFLPLNHVMDHPTHKVLTLQRYVKSKNHCSKVSQPLRFEKHFPNGSHIMFGWKKKRLKENLVNGGVLENYITNTQS